AMMEAHGKHGEEGGAYRRLAIELIIDFLIMYLVMLTMIDTLDHFYLNLNNVYVTLMIVTPMAVVKLGAMRSMFPVSRANWVVQVWPFSCSLRASTPCAPMQRLEIGSSSDR